MDSINHTFDISKIESINSKTKKMKRRVKFLGYNIAVKTECDSSFLKELALGDAPNFDDFFFEEDGTLKSTFISEFLVSRSISDHKLIIDFDLVNEESMMFVKIDIEGFKITPVFGKLYSVKFTVHLDPNDDELLFLNQAVQKDQLKISIIEPPQLSFEM